MSSAVGLGLEGLRGGSVPVVPRPARRWRTRVALPAGILLAGLGLLAYAARASLSPATQVRVVPVIARAAGGQGGEGTAAGAEQVVQAPGWVEPDPFAIVVPALVEGVIEEVLVLEGEKVEAGQVVAKMIDDELRLQEATARAMVAEREAGVASAVAAVEVPRAAVREAEAEADMVRDEIGRIREVVASGGASVGELRRLEIRLTGLEAGIAKAQSEVAMAQAGLASARTALDTSHALHAEAALRVERTRVKSPAGGVVMSRLVEPGIRMSMSSTPGEVSAMSGAVLRLYDPARLQVRVDVPLSDAARIGAGMRAEITTEALGSQRFEGVVTRVVHEANIQRNTVQFKVRVESPSPVLKPEMLVRVRFRVRGDGGTGGGIAGDASDTGGLELLVPRRVLTDADGDRARVWVVETTGTAVRAAVREVRLGREEGDEVVITSGVRPGDRAIDGVPAGLRPGARVRVAGEEGGS